MRFDNAVQVLTDALQIGMKAPQWKSAEEVGLMAPAKPDAKDWRVIECVEAGKVIAVVDRQPAKVRAWGWVCYGGTRSKAALDTLQQHIYEKAVKGDSAPANFITSLRQVLLVGLAMEDALSKARTGNAKHSPTAVATLAGIPRASWHRHYKALYELMVCAALTLDDRLKVATEELIWEQLTKQKKER